MSTFVKRLFATTAAGLFVLAGCQSSGFEPAEPLSELSVSDPDLSSPHIPVPSIAEPADKSIEPIEISSDDLDRDKQENTGLSEEDDADGRNGGEVGAEAGDEETDAVDAESGAASTDSSRGDTRNSQFHVLGLSVNQPRSEVISRLGQPSEHFRMNDPDGAITVYEYGGFTVGFNEQDRLEFIDVYDSSVDPSANGVRVGSAVSEAIRVFGEPEERTDYVMNYYTESTTLKIDLDPTNGQILSIKLFARD